MTALDGVLSRLGEEIGQVMPRSDIDTNTQTRTESTQQIETLLSNSSDPHAVGNPRLKELLDVAVEQMGAAFGAIFLPERQVDITCVSSDSLGADLALLYRKIKSYLMRYVVHRAEPISVHSLSTTKATPPHRLLAVPINFPGSKPIGLVAFLGPPGGPGIDQRLIYLARHVAREIAKIGEDRHDPATGLLSAVGMEEEVQRVLGSHPAGREHTVAYLDVDALGAVNECLGLEAGDEVIQSIAATLRRAILPVDTVVGRLKGDRFALFLPETYPAIAIQRMWLLQEGIDLISIGSRSRHLRVTISCGLALLPQLPATDAFSQALMAAELACRSAKNRGGDCLEVFPGIDDTMVCRQQDVLRALELRAALKGKA